jgi:PPOX class probable FMN-dependent enzyme
LVHGERERDPACLPADAAEQYWRMPAHRLTAETIDTEPALRALLGDPLPLIPTKIVDRLNALTRQFIERSPFMLLATADEHGHCDVSPRGDPAGFVRILDDATLLVPERPGNRMADSLRNILRNPHVGLLFVIPGVGDTFRVNGRGTLTTDAALLAPSAVEGKQPKLGILVDIEAAFTHCSKAFLRSELWNPARFVDRAELPSSGEIFRAIRGDDFDAETYDAERAARYARREGFY